MTSIPSHQHAAMRRKDRELTDRAEIDAIINQANVLHLALAEEDQPFVVPVFYAYDGEFLYFHSAKAGRKIEMLKRNPKVCFCISIDHGIIESDEPCDFEAKHRTVIGFGTASFVEEEAEKIAALDRIVARFTATNFTYPKANLKATAVLRIRIENLTGKKHGF